MKPEHLEELERAAGHHNYVAEMSEYRILRGEEPFPATVKDVVEYMAASGISTSEVVGVGSWKRRTFGVGEVYAWDSDPPKVGEATKSWTLKFLETNLSPGYKKSIAPFTNELLVTSTRGNLRFAT